MANFSRAQIETQIRAQLVREGIPDDVARSAGRPNSAVFAFGGYP